MAKTKAEIETDRDKYEALMSEARSALGDGRYEEAIKIAASSWHHIDGMMQFERKYEGTIFSNIEAIDIVLSYAPLMFHFQVLDELELVLKSQRRIDRDATDDLANDLSKARARMWDAHRLWNHLEKNGECGQTELRAVLGGDQEQWRSIVETWERMGLILRTSEDGSYRIAISMRMDAETFAKCPSCGVAVKWIKSKLLENVDCPMCHNNVGFVFLARAPGTST